MEYRCKTQTMKSPQVIRSPDGTYTLEHTWQAEAMLDSSKFACWVVQDEKPPVQANTTLWAQGGKRRVQLLAQPLWAARLETPAICLGCRQQ
ncbi:hypothetical protein J1605_001179 [Eschrichtius robustus]|uniref:Uncharacterized protein n=1 Tax=Eschrichtius robustus TaxID=9764 RepID=A0AB34GG39_ESCRO|nr:hypothetical protein J1605_001179 [Eschrichtius robustus]